MNILDFIRRNSVIVLIAIAGVGTGLIVMDYAGNSSLFSRDYYFKVGDTNYSYEDYLNLGEGGSAGLSRMIYACDNMVRNAFDKNKNQKIDDDEAAAMEAWYESNADSPLVLSRAQLQMTLQLWSMAPTKRAETNVAITRAIIRREGEELGLRPSREQIDAYLHQLPCLMENGQFSEQRYSQLSGREADHSTSQERAFRELVADIITWNALCELHTGSLSTHPSTQMLITDVLFQNFSGKSVWLPASAVEAPAEPTEEQIKAFWELNKDNYKTDERRIVTVYTLTAKSGSMNNNVTSQVMMQVHESAGRGLETILQSNAESPENPPFSFSKETLPICTLGELPEALKLEVPVAGGGQATLGQLAFTSVKPGNAPTLADYEKALAAGNTEGLARMSQLCGPFSHEGKSIIMRVEAVEAPTVLSYEDAREKALTDLRKQNELDAITKAGNELRETLDKALAKGQGDAAFTMAHAMGGQVSDFGPCSLQSRSTLPTGYTMETLLSVPSNKVAEPQISEEGASLAIVTSRTVTDDDAYRTSRMIFSMQANSSLKQMLIRDWLLSAYQRYELKLSENASGRD